MVPLLAVRRGDQRLELAPKMADAVADSVAGARLLEEGEAASWSLMATSLYA